MKVIKRDGTTVDFDRSKIVTAIQKANSAVDPSEQIDQQQIDAIHKEMDGLKGIFAMKRRKELEERMGRLLLELDKLSIGNEE